MSKKVILITGRSGLAGVIGRYVTDRLHTNYSVVYAHPMKSAKYRIPGFIRSLSSDDAEHPGLEDDNYEAYLDLSLNGISYMMCMIKSIEHKVGPIEMLVNNAGVNELNWYGKWSDDEVRRIFGVNTIGPLCLISEVSKLKSLKRIVNVSSVASRIPMRTTAPYNASKAAMDMITLQACRELAPKVFVAGVRPGKLKDTGMTNYLDKRIGDIRGWGLAEAKKKQIANIPLGRYVNTEEVAEVVYWLLWLAPKACTGCVIDVSGGQ